MITPLNEAAGSELLAPRQGCDSEQNTDPRGGRASDLTVNSLAVMRTGAVARSPRSPLPILVVIILHSYRIP